MKLPKSARLHHRSLQEKLFLEGEKIHEFPLKLVWRALTAEELSANFRDRVPDLIGPVQVLVSVPKKKRRRAVDRVLMRRRIREAFRHVRGDIVKAVEEVEAVRTVSVALIYMKEGNSRYAKIKEKMDALGVKLVEKVKEKYDDKEDSVATADSAD